jgi:hypothetical protein
MPTTAPARRPARPYALENVRPTTRFGRREQVADRQRLAAKSAYASSTKSSAGATSSRARAACRAARRPLGLCGLVTKTIRVAACTAARIVRRQVEVVAERTVHHRPPERRGVDLVHVERRAHADASGTPACDRGRRARREDALVEAVGQQHVIAGNAEIPGDRVARRVVIRVEAGRRSIERAQRRDDSRRAAGGVFVEVQSHGIHGSRSLVHGLRAAAAVLIRIDAA